MEFSDLWNIQFNKTAKTGRVDLPNGDFYDLEEGSWRSGDDFAVGDISDEFKQEQNIYHDVLGETPISEMSISKLHNHMMHERHHPGFKKELAAMVQRSLDKVKRILTRTPNVDEIGDQTNFGALLSTQSNAIYAIQALRRKLENDHEFDHRMMAQDGRAGHAHRGKDHPAYQQAFEAFKGIGGTEEDFERSSETVEDAEDW